MQGNLIFFLDCVKENQPLIKINANVNSQRVIDFTAIAVHSESSERDTNSSAVNLILPVICNFFVGF